MYTILTLSDANGNVNRIVNRNINGNINSNIASDVNGNIASDVNGNVASLQLFWSVSEAQRVWPVC